MIPASLQKNDKRANILIILFSIIVFVAVVFLSRVKLDVDLPFDVHVFAKINAVINSVVSFLLLVGLLAVKRSRYGFHKKVMMSAMVLSSGKLINVLAKSVSETMGIAAPVLYINICFKKMFDLRKNNK